MKQTSKPLQSKNKISILSKTAIFTAVTCVLAPLSIPIGPVPISLTNLVIYLSIYVIGWKMATNSYLIYLLIGMIGLPVFSGFTGGVGKLAGPTGGYLVGFVPMAIISGLFIQKYRNRWMQFVGFVIGTIVCYVFGTIWFCFSTGTEVAVALGLCVIPFLPGDFIKIVIAMLLSPVVNKRLSEADLL